MNVALCFTRIVDIMNHNVKNISCSIKEYNLLLNKCSDNSDSEPPNKVRKTTSIVVDQPDEDKVLVDNIPDNTLNMEEVQNTLSPH